MWSVSAGEQMPVRCLQRECRVSVVRDNRSSESLVALLCREQILDRKRREYRDMVPNYYDIQAAERSAEDDTALRQVKSHVICLSPMRSPTQARGANLAPDVPPVSIASRA